MALSDKDSDPAWATNSSCVMRVGITIHNCGNDVKVYELPEITQESIYRYVGKLFVKIASVELKAMQWDDHVPPCDPEEEEEAAAAGEKLPKWSKGSKYRRDKDGFMCADSDDYEEDASRRKLLGGDVKDIPDAVLVCEGFDRYDLTGKLAAADAVESIVSKLRFDEGVELSLINDDAHLNHKKNKKKNKVTGGFNGLPGGYLPEYVNCRVEEDSGDDKEREHTRGGDVNEIVIPPRNYYVRDLLRYCQNPTRVADGSPEQCCTRGASGNQICFYISATAGAEELPYAPPQKGGDAPVDGSLYLERAKPCDFGYCTNGARHETAPSPPPPPPFQMPPAPDRPGRPPTPPGVDADDLEAAELDPSGDGVFEYTLKNSAAPPPPSRAANVTVYSDCRPLPADVHAGLLTFNELPAFGVECALDHALISVSFEGCTVDTNAVGTPPEVCPDGGDECPGIRTAGVCIHSPHRATCAKVRSPLSKLAGAPIASLSSAMAGLKRCSSGSALNGFKVVADDRPWYVREKQPGMYAFEAQCCPVDGMDTCRTIIPEECSPAGSTENVEEALFAAADAAAAAGGCDADDDEIISRWRFTSVGCAAAAASEGSGGGGNAASMMRIEQTCCVSNSRRRLNVSAAIIAAVDDDDIARTVPALVDDWTAAPRDRSGPLIDRIIVEEGASYVPRALASAESAAGAFDAVKPRARDANARRFCRHASVPSAALTNFGANNLLSPCSGADSLAASTMPAVPDGGGNVFLRVSAKISVGFSGTWGFRLESHAFTVGLRPCVRVSRTRFGRPITRFKTCTGGDLNA